MCGIFGFTGNPHPGLLDLMQGHLHHRGPDDAGRYEDIGLWLGMTRLAIIDVQGGHQPIANEDGTVWLVFNGEIYNFHEMRQELEAKGHRFKTQSDTEVIVHGYEEYGPDVAHKLNGMFAIAVWDKRKRSLILIRDRYGVKPLFYAVIPEGLVFASEIKAVLCHPRVQRELDHEALSHYLSLRNIPSPYTIYKQVRSLEPGQILTWNEKGLQIRRWYNLPMQTAWSDSDEEELTDKMDALLQDSVRLRLRSDVPYGAYLSGGIDSSSVAAIMSRMSRKPIKTFCLAYEDAPDHKRDASYAREMARRLGTEHHEFVMSAGDLTRDLEKIVSHLDQPFAGVISSFWLSRLIKGHVSVALSGDGADDIFGSYGHHRLVWPVAGVQKNLQDVDSGFFKDRKDWVCALARRQPYDWRLEYAAFPQSEKDGILSGAGKAALGNFSTTDFLKKIYEESHAGEDDLNRMLYLDIRTLLPNEILYYADMLSMAHAVEVRSPFLDYRLVELACSIPGTLKIRGNALKYILRRVAARYLPADVIERPKEGFVLPKNTWLRGELASLVRQVLAPERLSLHGYFDHAAVQGLVRRFQAGEESLTFRVWTLMMFQLWIEKVFGASASAMGYNANVHDHAI